MWINYFNYGLSYRYIEAVSIYIYVNAKYYISICSEYLSIYAYIHTYIIELCHLLAFSFRWTLWDGDGERHICVIIYTN